MAIDAATIKELREKTGAGVMECKKALDETGGDITKAEEVLKMLSAATATKKAERATGQGRIHSYIHGPGRIGVMVEIRCESDFVANSEQFKELAKDICLQVAAMNPQAITRDDVPEDLLNFQKEQFKDDIEGKPEQIQEKILDGKLSAFYKEIVLLEQVFIKDSKQTVEDRIKEEIGVLKENITVARITRWELGGE